MNKTTVRVICAVLGFLMVASTITLIAAGFIQACGK